MRKDELFNIEMIKDEVSKLITRICIDRRMCAIAEFDCEALDRFITEEMRRKMDIHDEKPLPQFLTELVEDVKDYEEWKNGLKNE